jgi:hypothetical protein
MCSIAKTRNKTNVTSHLSFHVCCSNCRPTISGSRRCIRCAGSWPLGRRRGASSPLGSTTAASELSVTSGLPVLASKIQTSQLHKLHPVLNSLHCGCILIIFFRIQYMKCEQWTWLTMHAFYTPPTGTSSVQRASVPQQQSCRSCTNSSRTNSQDFEASPGGRRLRGASDVTKILIFEREMHCNVLLLKYWESSITKRKGGEKELLWCNVGWLSCSYGSWTNWRVSTPEFLCVAEHKADLKKSGCSLA